MSYREEEESKSNKGIIITGVIASVLIILAIISITNPLVLIGGIWDWDIENQLTNANEEAKASDLKRITLRITYDNNADTEIRIDRAIETYQQMYRNENNTHRIYVGDDGTILEMSWYVE